MEELLKQIKKALECKLYLVALQATLTLPDICSGLSSKNGKSNKWDYIKWYDENIIDKQNLSGQNCYFFRCGMLHEGKMEHENLEFSKIIFLEPNDMIICKGNIYECNGKKVLNIDVVSFCNEIINCTLEWWKNNKDDEIVKKNYETIVKYHVNGLEPFVVGIPIIA